MHHCSYRQKKPRGGNCHGLISFRQSGHTQQNFDFALMQTAVPRDICNPDSALRHGDNLVSHIETDGRARHLRHDQGSAADFEPALSRVVVLAHPPAVAFGRCDVLVRNVRPATQNPDL